MIFITAINYIYENIAFFCTDLTINFIVNQILALFFFATCAMQICDENMDFHVSARQHRLAYVMHR